MPTRVSQIAVEVAVQPTDAKARMSQMAVEVLSSPTDAKARMSQMVVEVLVSAVVIPTGPPPRTTMVITA